MSGRSAHRLAFLNFSCHLPGRLPLVVAVSESPKDSEPVLRLRGPILSFVKWTYWSYAEHLAFHPRLVQRYIHLEQGKRGSLSPCIRKKVSPLLQEC